MTQEPRSWRPGDPCPDCGAREHVPYTRRTELCTTRSGRDHKARWAGPLWWRRQHTCTVCGRTGAGCYVTWGNTPRCIAPR